MATNQRAPAPSVKRLMKEARQMAKNYDKTGEIFAQPIGDGDNLFDWHFTIRGPRDSPFENGIYHGRLLFPPDYPMKPPEMFLLNVSGRFETNVKICLSIPSRDLVAQLEYKYSSDRFTSFFCDRRQRCNRWHQLARRC